MPLLIEDLAVYDFYQRSNAFVTSSTLYGSIERILLVLTKNIKKKLPSIMETLLNFGKNNHNYYERNETDTSWTPIKTKEKNTKL